MSLLVLYTGLDDVERSRDDQGGGGTGDGGDKVLGPSCSIVVGETKRFFGERRSSKELHLGHQHEEQEDKEEG